MITLTQGMNERASEEKKKAHSNESSVLQLVLAPERSKMHEDEIFLVHLKLLNQGDELDVASECLLSGVEDEHMRLSQEFPFLSLKGGVSRFTSAPAGMS